MIHHVTLETQPDHVDSMREIIGLLGFEEVGAPEVFGGSVLWFEAEGTQIHLMVTDRPEVPRLGHVAVVARDYEAQTGALQDAGYEVETARELWGEPRSFVSIPGGGRIELMKAPPEPAT